MATASGDLTTKAAVKTYLGLTGTTEDDRIDALIDRVSQAIESHCNRAFASTAYSKERHDGNGLTRLRLKHYPVSLVSRLSTATVCGLKVGNDSDTSGAYHAFVWADSTTLSLQIDGGDDDGTETLTLASYATITALIAAVNAIGHGWSAEGEDTDAASYPATDLLPTDAKYSALDETVYLDVPDDPQEDYMLEDAGDSGILYHAGCFAHGTQNIVIDYTAGYSTIPDDIADACILWVAARYNRAKEGADGLKAENLGGESKTWVGGGMPDEVRELLAGYRELVL